MDLSTIILKIKDWSGRDNLSESLLTDIVNMSIKSIESHNFRCMRVRTNLTLIAGTEEYDNPFIRYKEFKSICLKDSSGNIIVPRVTQTSFGHLKHLYPSINQGPCYHMAEVPKVEVTQTPDIVPISRLAFGPIPDQAYVIEIVGYQYTPELSSGSDTNYWLDNHWDIILYGSLAQLEPYLGSTTLLSVWQAAASNKIKALIDSEMLEEFAGSPQIIDSNSDMDSFNINFVQ